MICFICSLKQYVKIGMLHSENYHGHFHETVRKYKIRAQKLLSYTVLSLKLCELSSTMKSAAGFKLLGFFHFSWSIWNLGFHWSINSCTPLRLFWSQHVKKFHFFIVKGGIHLWKCIFNLLSNMFVYILLQILLLTLIAIMWSQPAMNHKRKYMI